MKKQQKPWLPVLAVGALTLISGIAAAAVPMIDCSPLPNSGSDQPVTFAFTVTTTAPTLRERDGEGGVISENLDLVFENDWVTQRNNSDDNPVVITRVSEYGSRMGTERFGSRELLAALIDGNVIPGPIAGWAVKYVSYNDDNEYGEFWAVKRGEAPVGLSNYVDSGCEDPGAETAAFRATETTTFRYDGSGMETSRITRTTCSDVWTYMGVGGIEFDNLQADFTDDLYVYVGGACSESWSLRTFGSGDDQYRQFVPGAARFENLVGYAYDETADGPVDGIVKGYAFLGGARLYKNIFDEYPGFD